MDRVVAVVGDTTLLYSDIVLELEQLRAQGRTVPTDPRERDQLIREIVQQRVDDLLLLEAARASNEEVTASDVQDAVDQQVAEVQQQFGSEAALRQALQQSGRTLEEYRQTLTQQFIERSMVQRYLRSRMEQLPKPGVSEAEMREFFEAQRTRLGTRPANLSFQQAIVQPQPSDSAKARALRTAMEVLAELRKDGDFEVLARRYSADPSAQNGGMLGWFREGQMVRPFEAAAFAMRPGDIAGPVETEFGYHIIKLEKIRGPERQARHILIRPEITPDDIARARARADSFATAARGGASLTQLAEQSRTPSDQIQRRNVPADRLPEPYAALRDAQAGTVVGPIEVQGGASGTSFAVVKVTERQPEGQYELADVAAQVRDRLQEQKLLELIVAELRQTTHVAIQLSPAGA